MEGTLVFLALGLIGVFVWYISETLNDGTSSPELRNSILGQHFVKMNDTGEVRKVHFSGTYPLVKHEMTDGKIVEVSLKALEDRWTPLTFDQKTYKQWLGE